MLFKNLFKRKQARPKAETESAEKTLPIRVRVFKPERRGGYIILPDSFYLLLDGADQAHLDQTNEGLTISFCKLDERLASAKYAKIIGGVRINSSAIVDAIRKVAGETDSVTMTYRPSLRALQLNKL